MTDLEEIFDKAFELQKKAEFHIYSARDNGNVSPLQESRQKWRPDLPKVFNSKNVLVQEVSEEDLITDSDRISCSNMALSSEQKSILKNLFPHIYDTKPCILIEAPSSETSFPAINIGVVLSGGQAAGGHNVISGIFDFIKSRNQESKLYGFLCGPHGVYSHDYVEIDEKKMSHYRNMGGFDIIKSGRHKIETEDQKQKSLEICEKLHISGLVIIGGDDSNTNAAILSEYFKSKGSDISVIGCPKTIDGDLKNLFVEVSFGFDTAVKTYSESIGNLMMDAASCGGTYHFVRLMGRSASIITLECALQTRPNLAFIGEEVQAKNLSLHDLIAEVVDLVIRRSVLKKDYGVILLPEGLIEFIPEVGILISEINCIVAKGSFDESALSSKSLQVFQSLPRTTQDQLLLDRDPHGNVQVAMIATERLIIQMVKKRLEEEKFQGRFHAQAHYFGYEGRCGLPSNFDASYCYSLGNGAAALVQQKVTACMSIMKNMSKSWDANEWKAAGVPLTKMMTLETRKGKSNVPVIKKFLVDIEKPLFRTFEKVRDSWKVNDFYCSPGCPQLSGSLSHLRTFTLTGAPAESSLLPSSGARNNISARPFNLDAEQMSELQASRMSSEILMNSTLRNLPRDVVIENFPEQCNAGASIFPAVSENQASFAEFVDGGGEKKNRKVGIVLLGELVPGVSNILIGLEERMSLIGGTVTGFYGADGLMNEKCIELKSSQVRLSTNQGGFTFLGRTAEYEPRLGTEQGMEEAAKTCSKLQLESLLVIGWTYIHVSCLQEYFFQNNCNTTIFGVVSNADFIEFPIGGALAYLKSINACNISLVPYTEDQNFGISESNGCKALGFDTMSKCQSQLVGNLLTDAASAVKYFYFCLVGGGKGVEHEVTLQTHCNICISTDQWIDKSLLDVVNFVVEQVKKRCEKKKNYGCLVMNEDFFLKNKQLSSLALEIDALMSRQKFHESQIVEGENFPSDLESSLSSNSLELIRCFPHHFQQQLISLKTESQSMNLKNFPTHELLASLVSKKIKEEIERGFKGNFSPICFSLISQVRSSLPSVIDCCHGKTLGYVAGTCAFSRALPSFIFIENLAHPPNKWKPCLIPLSPGAVLAHGLSLSASSSDSLRAGQEWRGGECGSNYLCRTLDNLIREGQSESGGNWLDQDAYCNPGPIQFEGEYITSYTRSMYENEKLSKLKINS